MTVPLSCFASPDAGLLPMGQPSAPPDGGDERPAIDLVHLSRQTSGDRDLETELLSLFARQARSIVQALAAAAEGGELPQASSDLAHTLCGSARAVGSWSVAAHAQRLEGELRAGAAAQPGRNVGGLMLLSRSVDRACAAIEDLLQGRD